MPIKIRACDTMGYGVPYPEATLPRERAEDDPRADARCGVPPEWLEWHGHNDFHKVLVNATTAWLYGCAAANCDAARASASAPATRRIEGLDHRLHRPAGATERHRHPRHHRDRRLLPRRRSASRSPTNYPFVGANFNVTSAGIHADGMLKNEEIYNIFDTGQAPQPADRYRRDRQVRHRGHRPLGQRPPRTATERQVDKRHPGLQKISQWVEEQYDGGADDRSPTRRSCRRRANTSRSSSSRDSTS